MGKSFFCYLFSVVLGFGAHAAIFPGGLGSSVPSIFTASSSISASGAMGLFNRNPLNIKALSGSDMWLGQVGKDSFGHAIFSEYEYGIRAGALVLKNYQMRHKIDTLAGIVERFAEGNRKEYIAFLSKRLGLQADQAFSIIDRLPDLLAAMARFETGIEYPASLFAPYSLPASILK